MFKTREASSEPSLWVARPIQRLGSVWARGSTTGSTAHSSGCPNLGRNHHCGGCNLRTKISSRSSHVLLREGTAPRGALRGLSAPDRPDAGRLISRQVGCRGLAHRVHRPVWGQEGSRAVMIPLPHQARLLLTGATGHKHGERGGIIPVSRVKAAWTGEARACAQKRKRLLGALPLSLS